MVVHFPFLVLVNSRFQFFILGFTLFGAPQRQKQSQQHQSVEQQKCSSDSGLSSSEFEHANDMLNSEFP